MKSSSIHQPPNNRYIQLNQWQVNFCQNNHCAALLLSIFISWHDWKLRNDQCYRSSSDTAEIQGDGRTHNEKAYLFFTTNELIDGCMGLYGKKAIADGLKLLVSLGVISIHINPSSKYRFDKTRHFQFSPEVCNQWIAENYPIQPNSNQNSSQAIDYIDTPKIADRDGEKARWSGENGRPSGENRPAITNTTNNTTNNKQSINPRDEFLENDKAPEDQSFDPAIKPLVDALLAKGMSQKKFYPDTLSELSRLQQEGITVDKVIRAYDFAERITHSRGFGLNYLLKVLIDQREQGVARKTDYVRQRTSRPNHHFESMQYETDLSKGAAWIEGDN